MKTEEIISAIHNNNSRKLMKALYSMAYPPVLRHVRQKRGTNADAEDCFQEAVITLIKKVKDNSYNQQYEVKNFLFVVARNIWFNRIKRMQKFTSYDVQEYSVEDVNIRVDQQLMDKEKQSAVATLLNTAGDRCKQLLHLILYENKKLKEIAEIMDFSSEEVVKTNHYRCKKKLKEELKRNTGLLELLKQ